MAETKARVTNGGVAWDAVVVGGGHNGLVTAAYLAKSGLRTLVLERRERVGGAADTVELGPGIRVPALAHTVGRFRPSIHRDLELKRHGLSLMAPDVRLFAPSPDGSAVVLWGDVAKTAEGLRARSGARPRRVKVVATQAPRAVVRAAKPAATHPWRQYRVTESQNN